MLAVTDPRRVYHGQVSAHHVSHLNFHRFTPRIRRNRNHMCGTLHLRIRNQHTRNRTGIRHRQQDRHRTQGIRPSRSYVHPVRISRNTFPLFPPLLWLFPGMVPVVRPFLATSAAINPGRFPSWIGQRRTTGRRWLPIASVSRCCAYPVPVTCNGRNSISGCGRGPALKPSAARRSGNRIWRRRAWVNGFGHVQCQRLKQP